MAFSILKRWRSSYDTDQPTMRLSDLDLTLGSAPIKVVLAAGTGSGVDVTVTGMAVGDELVTVLSFTTAASIASVADRTSEYTVQSGGLDKAAGTNETNNQLLIIYLDRT